MPETRWKMFSYNMGNVCKRVGYSYTRPLHWQGKQWATFGYTAAGTGLLHFVN